MTPITINTNLRIQGAEYNMTHGCMIAHSFMHDAVAMPCVAAFCRWCGVIGELFVMLGVEWIIIMITERAFNSHVSLTVASI